MHEAHMLTLLRQIRDCMCFSFSSHHISWTFRLPLITPAPSRPGRHAVIWTLTTREGNNSWDERVDNSTLAEGEGRFGCCLNESWMYLKGGMMSHQGMMGKETGIPATRVDFHSMIAARTSPGILILNEFGDVLYLNETAHGSNIGRMLDHPAPTTTPCQFLKPVTLKLLFR